MKELLEIPHALLVPVFFVVSDVCSVDDAALKEVGYGGEVWSGVEGQRVGVKGGRGDTTLPTPCYNLHQIFVRGGGLCP